MHSLHWYNPKTGAVHFWTGTSAIFVCGVRKYGKFKPSDRPLTCDVCKEMTRVPKTTFVSQEEAERIRNALVYIYGTDDLPDELRWALMNKGVI